MQILTVTELTSAIKGTLEPKFQGILVKGEISNFKLQSSGHLYFSLKDAGAQIAAALFKGNAISLTRLPKDGDQVIATGEISVYAPRGQYQIIVRKLEFLGVGELLMKFHLLKETLQARGWFDADRKKPLPQFPKRIGVVTSPTGAAIRDILNILKRRFTGAHVILNPVRVQGEMAAREIAQAIDTFNRYDLVDVMIVGRGGGSMEDLWAFNEEVVAKAIFESKIPIISAIGHETDFTIADWVADLRAPTPSAAAEIAVFEKTNLLKFLADSREVCYRRLQERTFQEKRRLIALKQHPLFSSPQRLLFQKIQQLDAMRAQLDLLRPSNRIAQWKEKLAPLAERFELAIRSMLREKKAKLSALFEHLSSLNPNNLLKKGYAILFSEKESSIILSANSLSSGKSFVARLADGKIRATVDQVEHHGK